MPRHHIDRDARALSLRAGALLGCAGILAIGCASDHETTRHDPSAQERAREPHEAHQHTVSDRERARAEQLDDHERVPDATLVSTNKSDAPIVLDDPERGDVSVQPVEIAGPDQGSSAADRKVNARIRKSIDADNKLSARSKDVQITSSANEVTLRGAVATAEEKTRVGSYAEQAAGTRRVINELEIRN
jgi:hypothetical protein